MSNYNRTPDYNFANLCDITPEDIKNMGVKAIGLDLDNTTVLFGSYTPVDGAKEWVDSMRNAGIKVIIISNTLVSRAHIIAKKLGGVPCIAPAFKPSGISIIAAAALLGISVNEIAMVGDKFSTDIEAANRTGAVSIKVESLKRETPVIKMPKVNVKMAKVAAVAAITTALSIK